MSKADRLHVPRAVLGRLLLKEKVRYVRPLFVTETVTRRSDGSLVLLSCGEERLYPGKRLVAFNRDGVERGNHAHVQVFGVECMKPDQITKKDLASMNMPSVEEWIVLSSKAFAVDASAVLWIRVFLHPILNEEQEACSIFKPSVRIWRFHEAPLEYQALSSCAEAARWIVYTPNTGMLPSIFYHEPVLGIPERHNLPSGEIVIIYAKAPEE